MIKANDKVMVRNFGSVDFLARVLWVRDGEAGIREVGTKREDIYPVGRLTPR
jgi:hypothetical protein